MNKAIKGILDKKIVIATVMASVIAVAYYFCFGIHSNIPDDYIISVLIQSGDTHSLFLSYFVSSLNVLLQKALPFVNVFVLLEMINCVVSVIIINYVLLSKQEGKIWYGITFAFDLVFIYIGNVMVQWTHTAVFMCSAGLSLLLYAIYHENRKRFKVLQIIVAAFVTLWGSFYRFTVFEVCIGLFSLVCFCLLIESTSKEKAKTHSIKRALLHGIKSNASMLISVALVLFVAFGLNVLSGAINNATDHYAEFKEYNSARSAVNDYDVAPYEGNEEFYSSIGIESAEDIAIIKRYCTDKDFFDVDRLRGISEYANDNGYGTLTVLGIINMYFDAYSDRISKFLPSGMNFDVILLIIILLGIAVLFLLFALRNRIKALFPIMLSIVWIAFFVKYGITDNSLIGLFIALFVVLTVFVHNRFHFLQCISISLAVIGLHFYMSYVRCLFRVTLSYFMPAIVFLLIVYSKDRLRAKACTSLKTYRFAYITLSSFFISIIVAISGLVLEIPQQWGKAYNNIDKTIYNYVETNSDTLFLYNTRLYSRIDKSRRNLLDTSNCPDNAVVFGDWQIASDYYLNLLEKNGIYKLYSEMIDNPNRKFILLENDAALIEKYYNNHYRTSEKCIVLEKTKSFIVSEDEIFGVYRVISE